MARIGLLQTGLVALIVGFSASAHGQVSSPIEQPGLVSALEECETGAREGRLTGRALGACDVALRSGDLSDSVRARLLINRGVIALQRNEADPALSDLEEAVRIAPDLSEGWLSLSAARIKARRLDGAIDAAEQALALDVVNPALAYFNIAIAHETAGRFDAAYDAYLEAASLAPDNATLQAQPPRFLRHQAPAMSGTLP